jgi:lysyl-tRNA synthetase class 2
MSVFDSILQYNPDLCAEDLNAENASTTATKLGIKVKESWGLGKIQIEIFEATVEEKLMQPTFITEYPTEVSPLARRNDNNPFITDRFELFIGGREIASAFKSSAQRSGLYCKIESNTLMRPKALEKSNSSP